MAITYDYNTGLPLAPGQAQSQYNTQTGQKIGSPPPAPTTPTVPTNYNNYSAPPINSGVPVPTYGSTITDTSGNQGIAKFDPNTGKPLANPNAPATTNPTGPTASGVTDNETLAQLLSKYQQDLLPTSTMTDLQKQAADLEAARRTSDTAVDGEGINVGAKTGYESLIDKQSLDKENAAQAQYAIAQQQQQAVASGDEAAIESAKGVPVSYLGSIYNPLSGQTTGGLSSASGSGAGTPNPATGLTSGSSSQDVLGYLAANGVDVTRYNTVGLLNAVQNGATAQDIIAGKVNVAAQTAAATSASSSGAGYVLGPDGNYVQPNASASASYPPSNFGTPAASSGSGSGSLQQGSSGASVSALQNFLVKQGYMTAAQVATGPGTYGPQTAAAVAAFQRASGINTSGGGVGVFGPQTQAAAAAKGLSLAGTLGTSSASSGGSYAFSPGTPTKSSSGSSANASPFSSLSGAAYTLATTGEYPSGTKTQIQQNAALAEVRKVIPNFNPTVAKANAAAIADQTTQQADTARGITAADSNFGLLTNTFQGKVNNNSSPLANEVNNLVQKGALGNSDVINFQSAVSTLQTEYATVLGRGGAVTDSVRSSAQNVINGNYSMNDLIALHNYIDKEGKNVIDSYTKTITNLASGGVQSSSSGGSSGSNPLSI